MDLWHGSVSEFVRQASSGALSGDMAGQFVKLHRYVPNLAEVRSWENSLHALAQAVEPLGGRDVGVSIASSEVTGPPGGSSPVREAAGEPPAVSLEYHLPLTGKRIDALFSGHDATGQAGVVSVELKQWSKADLEDEHATNLLVNGTEHVHPSEQAADYAAWLSEYHGAFTTGGLVASSASYCHNMKADVAATTLRDGRYEDLLRQSPLFIEGEEELLTEFVDSQVGAGGGVRLLDKLFGARFQPSKRVMDSLEAVLDAREEWHLLAEQRLAFNAILAEVRRQRARAGQCAVVVRGAPGTGKTVVAVQLLAASLRLGWKAAHSTGGKAFTTALRSKFKGAHDLFIWNMNTRKAPTQGLDLLLVDEAHRVRETSDTRWTPSIERGKRSQTEELLNAAKVTVFLLDENQFVRPDEVGCTSLVQSEGDRLGIRTKVFDLATQFRCGGCVEYVAWVDWLLGFEAEKPEPWGTHYSLDLVETPTALESLIPEAKLAGETARLVAGFCWRWSDAPKDGDLVPDVVIGDWSRPWNEKPKNKQYKPADHPYTKWAETDAGEHQIGCIYSAQGFEFSRVGVVWGMDLVWRTDQWIAQKAETFDRPVKSSKDILTLVRNAYRVLLTRGLRGARLLILDEETRAHVGSTLEGMQS